MVVLEEQARLDLTEMKTRIILINTTRCNFSCKHCIREYPQTHADIPLPLVEKLLTQSKALGFKSIALTGGEPSHHPDFQALVGLIVAHGFLWSAVTNGYDPMPYRQALEAHADECDYMAVSFDGADAATHDAIRQSCSFTQAWRAVDRFKEKGATLHSCFTVNSRNHQQVEDFITLAEAHGIDKTIFASVTPTPFNQDLVLSRRQKTRVYARLQNLKDRENMSVRFTTSLYGFPESSRFCSNLNDPEPAINPYGEYIQCCDNQGQGAVIGELHTQDFDQLFLKHIMTSVWLRAQREEMIAKGEYFPGFNSCQFCNTLMKERIRHA